MASIFIASSWRNSEHAPLIQLLRECGHEVYDYRAEPFSGDDVPGWKASAPTDHIEALAHPFCERAFALDFNALKLADVVVLLNPSGRAAHMEAGYAVGTRKRLIILLEPGESLDLTYKMASDLVTSFGELVELLKPQSDPRGHIISASKEETHNRQHPPPLQFGNHTPGTPASHQHAIQNDRVNE